MNIISNCPLCEQKALHVIGEGKLETQQCIHCGFVTADKFKYLGETKSGKSLKENLKAFQDLPDGMKKWHKDANQRFWIPTTMALPFGILYPFTDTEDTMKWAFAKMKDIPKKEQKNYPDGKGNFYDKMYDTENANIYDEFFEGLLELNTMAKSLEINTSEEKKINLPKMKKVK
tara:strand:+ start:138 stop:659 length:522 start_codon:yes stop_codon:yes gene_type:complete